MDNQLPNQIEEQKLQEQQAEAVVSAKPTTLGNLFNNKKVIIVIGLILLGIVLIFAFLSLTKKGKMPTPQMSSTPKSYSGSVHFLAENVTISPTTTEITTDIIAESPFRTIGGVTVGLQYDSAHIEVTNFRQNTLQTSLLGNTAKLTDFSGNFESYSKTRITVLVPPTTTERKGSGTIGAITFKVKNMKQGDTTSVNFYGETDLLTRAPGALFKLTKTPLTITVK